MTEESMHPPKPSLLDALLPVSFLIVALFVSVRFYGEDSSYGPNQIVLMLAGVLAMVIGLKNGLHWRTLEKRIYTAMDIVFAPSLILLAVGIMIAIWIAAGIVPTLIYYGLQIMNPSWFYAAACLICALVSLSIGSSWTTAASIGVALIGMALGMGLSVEITAGAIISGAYFGDKMSPLSDTTNLAAAVVNVDLFEHIRHMGWTGLPSLVIALVGFLIIGVNTSSQMSNTELTQTLEFLQQAFFISWYLLMPLVLLLLLAWRKIPALPALLIASGAGALFAVWCQPQVFVAGKSIMSQLWLMSVNGFEANIDHPILSELLSGGGAANMLNTIWLILSAVFFGSAMEKTGLLQTILKLILHLAKRTASLITATVITGIGTNIITGDQYIAIVLPGRMYQSTYAEHKLAPVNLSRALEDSATVTSPLVPWNTCGAYMAATLGVATFDYLPYCFFNLAMPLISILYGVLHFKILALQESEEVRQVEGAV